MIFMKNDIFPELNEHAEIKQLVNTNANKAVPLAMLNLSLAIVNTRSVIQTMLGYVKDSISDLKKTIETADKSSKKLSLIIVIATSAAVLVAVIGIGWDVYKTLHFEHGTTKIKENCSAEAHLDPRATSQLDDTKRQEFINNYYDDCLMRFGLK
jgi:hypothetical protein